MDDIEALVRAARPVSGHRDRDLSERAERDLDAILSEARARREPSRRSGGRARKPRKRRVRAVLLAAVVAVCAAVGVGAILEGASPGPRSVAQPAAPDPTRVLSAAAEKLDMSTGQSESATTMPDPGDSRAIIAGLTSGALTRQEQAAWLWALADGGVAVSAERGTDGTWRVSVSDLVVVIRARTGEITAVVDAEGETHAVPPAV